MSFLSEKPRLSMLLICLALLFFSFDISAQDLDDVTLSGKIADSNGLAVAGATVTATQLETGIERNTNSNEEGRYRLVDLKPGTYTVKVTLQGFATQEKTNLTTLSGQNVQLDFSLSPAGVTAEQIITLEGEDAPLVDTTRTVVGGTVTRREIEELPNSTRNPLDLIFTLGGVGEEPLSTRDLAQDKGGRGEAAPSATTEEAGISLATFVIRV